MSSESGNGPVENVIFNPEIYGYFRVKENTFDEDQSQNYNKSVFETKVILQNDLYLTNSNNINFYDAETESVIGIQCEKLLEVNKIVDIQTDVANLDINLNNQIKAQQEFENSTLNTLGTIGNNINTIGNNINSIALNLNTTKSDLQEFKTTITNKLETIESSLNTINIDLQFFKNTVNDELSANTIKLNEQIQKQEDFENTTLNTINTIGVNIDSINADLQASKLKTISVLNANTIFSLNTMTSNIYLIKKKIKITLPIIGESIVGKEYIFKNTVNDTISITTQSTNNINNNDVSKQSSNFWRISNSISYQFFYFSRIKIINHFF